TLGGLVAGWAVKHFFPNLIPIPSPTPTPVPPVNPTPPSNPNPTPPANPLPTPVPVPSLTGNPQLDAIIQAILSLLTQKLTGKAVSAGHAVLGQVIAVLGEEGKTPAK